MTDQKCGAVSPGVSDETCEFKEGHQGPHVGNSGNHWMESGHAAPAKAPPTRGDLAKQFTEWKRLGVTSQSIRYALAQAFHEGSTSLPKIQQAVQEGLGAASVCWDADGVFMSERALEISDKIMGVILPALREGVIADKARNDGKWGEESMARFILPHGFVVTADGWTAQRFGPDLRFRQEDAETSYMLQEEKGVTDASIAGNYLKGLLGETERRYSIRRRQMRLQIGWVKDIAEVIDSRVGEVVAVWERQRQATDLPESIVWPARVSGGLAGGSEFRWAWRVIQFDTLLPHLAEGRARELQAEQIVGQSALNAALGEVASNGDSGQYRGQAALDAVDGPPVKVDSDRMDRGDLS